MEHPARKVEQAMRHGLTVLTAMATMLLIGSKAEATWWCAPLHGNYPQVSNCPAGGWYWVQHPGEPAEPPKAAEGSAWLAGKRAYERCYRQNGGYRNPGFTSPAQYQRWRSELVDTCRRQGKEVENRIRGERRAKQQEAARRAAAEAAREKKTAEEAAEKQRVAAARQAILASDAAQGYRRMKVTDFRLDAKELAAASAKVSLTGAYTKEPGGAEELFVGSFAEPVVVMLITSEAPRDARKLLIECQLRPLYYGMMGCSHVTLLGHAAACSYESLLGQTGDDACLVVENVRMPPQ